MTTSTTTAFGRISNNNSAKANAEIILANKALWDSQNADNKALVELLESQGRDSQGQFKRGFMGSLLQYISSYGYLSEKQTAALRKIAETNKSQKEIVSNTKSKALGNKNDEVTLELVVDRQIKKYNDNPKFGWDAVKYFTIMSDKSGNRVVYSGSSSKMTSLQEGTIYSMTVVIKDHLDREGEKQTYVFAPKAAPKKLTKFSVKRTRKAAAKTK